MASAPTDRGSPSSRCWAELGTTARTCSWPPARRTPARRASSSYRAVWVKSASISGAARLAGSQTRSRASGSPPARRSRSRWNRGVDASSRSRSATTPSARISRARTTLVWRSPAASTRANREYSVPSGCAIRSWVASRGRRPRSATTMPSARRSRSADRTVWRLTPYSSTSASSPGKSSSKAPASSRRLRSARSCAHSGSGLRRSSCRAAVAAMESSCLRLFPGTNDRTFNVRATPGKGKPAMLEVLPIETPALGDRSYLVHDGETALVIDPQRDIDRVIALADGAGVRVTHVAETHMHNDYVTGGFALARAAGAAYLVNADDPVSVDRTPVSDGDLVEIGGMQLRALATPGHTYSHLAYVVEAGG